MSDSLKRLWIRLVLIARNEQGAPLPIQLETHNCLQGLTLTFHAEKAWMAKLQLFDRRGDYIESLILAAQPLAELQIEFGWVDENPENYIRCSGVVTVVSPTFKENGIALEIEVVPSGAFVPALDKQIRAAKVGERVSDTVQRIATARNWHSIIEPTTSKIEREITSNGENDLAFITGQLLPLAMVSKGGKDESGYVCSFDENNFFHFHTPSYYPVPTVSYVFARASAGDVLEFGVEDARVLGAIMGAGAAIYMGSDLREGQEKQVTADSLRGVGLQGMPSIVGGDSIPRFPSTIQAYVPLRGRDSAEMRLRAQYQYDVLRRQFYKGKLVVVGNPRLKPYADVFVDWIKDDGSVHYLSGQFLAWEVQHEISGGVWKTSATIQKQGIGMPKPGTDKAPGVPPPSAPTPEPKTIQLPATLGGD